MKEKYLFFVVFFLLILVPIVKAEDKDYEDFTAGVYHCSSSSACDDIETLIVNSEKSYDISFGVLKNASDYCVQTAVQFPKEYAEYKGSSSSLFTKFVNSGSQLSTDELILGDNNWYTLFIEKNSKEKYIPVKGDSLDLEFKFYSQEKGYFLINAVVDIYEKDCVKKLKTLYPTKKISFDELSEKPDYEKFTDIDNNAFAKYITNLQEDGIITGYPDGRFGVNDTVTRGAMSKFIVNAFDIPILTTCTNFPDVGTDNVFYREITTLKCKGIINGYKDGGYHPNDPVTRGAVTKFIVEARKFAGKTPNLTLESSFKDVHKEHKFYPYIAYLSGVQVSGDNIIRGYSDGGYHPNDTLTRGAMAKIVDLGSRNEVGTRLR